jgi:hypothetical protein
LSVVLDEVMEKLYIKIRFFLLFMILAQDI